HPSVRGELSRLIRAQTPDFAIRRDFFTHLTSLQIGPAIADRDLFAVEIERDGLVRARALLVLRETGTCQQRNNSSEHDYGSTGHLSIYVTNRSRVGNPLTNISSVWQHLWGAD